MSLPHALLFTAPGCPHCPGVKASLKQLLAEGLIGALEVQDVSVAVEQAAELGIRSVPWLKLGDYILTGAQTPQALRQWAVRAGQDEGFADYIKELLGDGRLAEAEELLEKEPRRLTELLPMLSDLQLPIHIRLGLSALFEGQAGSAALQALIPQLAGLTRHTDHRVRGDACHYLSLSGSHEARPLLEACLEDAHPEVREIAAEALEQLQRD